MVKSKLPRSIRKYIRLEKARIRREHVFDKEKQKQEIKELYKGLKIDYDKNKVGKIKENNNKK